MNYAKMIEILEWVKANRKDGRGANTNGIGSSPYVCDNINRFVVTDDPTLRAKADIKADIKGIINGRFGVPEYLGYDDDQNDGLDSNYYPNVVAFRTGMIDGLIARYMGAQNAAV